MGVRVCLLGDGDGDMRGKGEVEGGGGKTGLVLDRD